MPSTWSESRSIVKALFIHFLRMATPAPDLHALSIPRLNTSTTMDMIWIHYHTLQVSLRSQGSHREVATWCSTSAMTSPQLREKLTSNSSFANCIMPAVPNTVARRLKKKSVEGDPDQEI
jgi:hypothetical protein